MKQERVQTDRYTWMIAWGAVVCLVVIALATLAGSASLNADVFWRMRVPRVLCGFVAGAALSLSGMCYQGMFRNALATPYTLGVSGGAALGVSVVLKFHLFTGTLVGVGMTSLWAFTGAIVSVALVCGLARLKGGGSSLVLLLSGVAVSFFFSSLIMFMQYIGSQEDVYHVTRWMMGGLDVYDYGELSALAVICAIGVVIVLSQLEALNLLAVSEEFAASRGVSLKRTGWLLHGAVSLMVGTVVAICGPIGFVGMVCPHVSRLLTGANHRRLAPLSMLLGGVFLVVCDVLGRCLLPPAEIPVGVVTALLGGPFFLWLLLRK